MEFERRDLLDGAQMKIHGVCTFGKECCQELNGLTSVLFSAFQVCA